MISIVMGSKSDWQTMKFAADICEEFMLDYETKVVSAHRTPQRLYQYSRDLEDRDVKVVIAGAGGAAHLPGVLADPAVRPEQPEGPGQRPAVLASYCHGF